MVSVRPNNQILADTFKVFIPETRINHTALPQNPQIKNDKFEKKYGMLYTGAAIATGAGMLYFLHRGGKLVNFADFVKKHVNNITAKTAEKMKDVSNLDFFQKIKLKTALAFSSVLKKSQGLGNVNPIKDTAFNETTVWIEKHLKIPVKKFFDSITNFLTRYGKKLTSSQYQKPQMHLYEFGKTLNEATDAVSKLPEKAFTNGMPKDKVIDTLRKLRTISTDEFASITSNFGQRFDNTVEILNEKAEPAFWETVKNMKGSNTKEKLLSKFKEFGDFIPYKNMQSEHKQLFAPLQTSKMKISNSILDLTKTLSTNIDDIFYENGVLQNDTLRKGYLSLKELIGKFANPKKYNVIRANVKAELLKKLSELSGDFAKILPESGKAEKIKELAHLVQNDEKGAVETAVSLCKVLKDSNPALYNKLVKQRNLFQKSFNNAVEFETNSSYRKLLDFSLHSVPTDMMTQFVGLGTVGYILANRKKSMKEKVPSILKEGIPVVGGLATAFLCNLRQVASGPSALFLAIISGFVLNRLGTVVSEKFIEQNKKDVA